MIWCWSIRRRPGVPSMIEVHVWRGLASRCLGGPILATSFNCARAMLPRTLVWAQTDGAPGSDDIVEWWALPMPPT